MLTNLSTSTDNIENYFLINELFRWYPCTIIVVKFKLKQILSSFTFQPHFPLLSHISISVPSPLSHLNPFSPPLSHLNLIFLSFLSFSTPVLSSFSLPFPRVSPLVFSYHVISFPSPLDLIIFFFSFFLFPVLSSFLLPFRLLSAQSPFLFQSEFLPSIYFYPDLLLFHLHLTASQSHFLLNIRSFLT